MNWRQEAKEATQQMYGGYCEMCKGMNINPLPYHKFDTDIYRKTKIEWKLYLKTIRKKS